MDLDNNIIQIVIRKYPHRFQIFYCNVNPVFSLAYTQPYKMTDTLVYPYLHVKVPLIFSTDQTIWKTQLPYIYRSN
jgi:hypothetical protein